MPPAAEPVLIFAIRSPIARGDLPGLCARVCELLEASRSERAVCDVAGARPDAVTADALARLQLAARRHGCWIELRRVPAALRELLDLMGLDDVVAAGGLRVPPHGQYAHMDDTTPREDAPPENENADTPPALPSEDDDSPLGDTDQHSDADA